ncbi:hypothetical protein [Desulfosporosinus metallidurans]|uniref:Uncharacterized protein n=1 Tax=Desulfosporosinus metallidurans TaxID=1888891 RepID=A0A1Q8QG29_9FIRM|nr:hypothetical protein [Desulfosporosinus metallidurans]OLN26248.1 hypothetical protein DSOL_5076 [Desulfosporosinus metallidurans]
MLYFSNIRLQGNILIEKFRFVAKFAFVKTLFEEYNGDDKPECVIQDITFFDINNQKLDIDSLVKRKLNDNGNEKLKIVWMVEEMEFSFTFASARIKYFVNESQEAVLEDDLDIVRQNIEELKKIDVDTKNEVLLQLRLENIEENLKFNPYPLNESKLREERAFLISVLL